MGNPRARLYLDGLFSDRRRHNCWSCGELLDRASATADHLLPQSHGGTDSKANLRPCCWTCNNERGNRLLTEAEWVKAREWQPRVEPPSPRVRLLSEAIKRYRAVAQVNEETKEKKTMKIQIWLTEHERDLVETALKSLIEEADKESVGNAVKKCRGYVSRRIAELLTRIQKQEKAK